MTARKPEPAAVWVPVAALTPWPGNPRKNADAVALVAKSIARFGFAAPIVARQENGEIIAGDTRYRAALSLGLDAVPVRYVDLTEDEAHALALADNKLGEIALWDNDRLGDALRSVGGGRYDLGWTDDELRDLLAPLPPADEPTTSASSWAVVVECAGGREQSELIDRLTAEGWTCRAQ